MTEKPGKNAFVKFLENRFEEIRNPDIDETIRDSYFREFEELNTTTSSIYDLGDEKVLIILKDGTNLTDWSDVDDKKDIIYVSEDVSSDWYLSSKYSELDSLKSIIVKNVTGNVSSLSYMFSNCFSLQYVLGIDTWDTSNMKNMNAMFLECISIRDFSFLESLNVSNVRNMEAMFQGCISLMDTSPLGSWDVGNVRDMHAMLCLCHNLDSLKGLELWDVANVETMESMFHGCMKLDDVSCLNGWKPDNIENMFEMFRDCPYLENADALDGWNIGADVITESMFRNSDNAQKPEWYCDLTKEIEAYVKGIDDEETLIEIAYNHSDYITRKFAVERISDENILKDIIQNCYDPGVIEAAIKNRNLKDYDFLIEQFEDPDFDSVKGIFIIWRIDDEHYLTRIAKSDYRLKYRILAINKISDKSVLVDLTKDENDTIRNFAVNRLYTI